MMTDTRLARLPLPNIAARALRMIAVAAVAGKLSLAAAAVPPPSESPEYEPPPSGSPEYEPPPSESPEYEPPPSEPPEYEPPPSEWPPPVKPPLTNLRPAPPRVTYELGLAGSALVNRGVYGFGGSLDLGARFRLRFGALGVALRVGLEQHIQPEPAPFLMNLGVAFTYLIARPHWRVSPYVGVWVQGMLQRIPDALGNLPLQHDEGGLTLGGLAGAQVRLGRSGIFTELGYRQTVYKPTTAAIPAWNAVQLLFGYRVTTN